MKNCYLWMRLYFPAYDIVVAHTDVCVIHAGTKFFVKVTASVKREAAKWTRSKSGNHHL